MLLRLFLQPMPPSGKYWGTNKQGDGEMMNAYELLLNAPDAQVVRCQLAWKAVAAGEWREAAHFLRNAAAEEGDTAWADEAQALADGCMKRHSA